MDRLTLLLWYPMSKNNSQFACCELPHKRIPPKNFGPGNSIGPLGWIVSMGVGLLPGPKGTYGSILTAFFIWLGLTIYGGDCASAAYLVLLGAFTPLAIFLSDLAESRQVFGPGKDPSSIVIDEAAGMLLACLGMGLSPWWHLPLALAAFRFFDIKKPFPINRLQNLPGGLGIVVDDLAAGGCALGLVWLLDLLIS